MKHLSRILIHGLLLLQVIFPGRLEGQCYFDREWDVSTSTQDVALGLDVLATNDGYTQLIVAKPVTFSARGILLVHTDACGTQLWKQYYAVAFPPASGRLERTADGGYLVYAHVPDTSTSSDALFMKTDSLGNVQWSNRCGGPGAERSGRAIPTSDGGYLVYSSAAEPTYQPSGHPLLLMKTDSTGQTQWSYEYYDTGPTQAAWQDVIECPASDGGGYLVIESHMLLRVGPNGMQVWSRRFTGLELKRAFSITSGYMLAATCSIGPSLVKIDPNGVLVWHKTFPAISSFTDLVVHDAIQTSGGGFALAGEARDLSNLSYPRHGVLLRTDPEGALQFFKSYHPFSECAFYGVDQDNAGGFVLTGYVAQLSDTATHLVHTNAGGMVYCNEVDIGMSPMMYVLAAQNYPLLRVPQGHNDPFAVNQSPFLHPDTITCMFIVGMDEMQASVMTEVFPNPSNGTFTISRAGTGEGAATIVLLDMSGRIVREEKFVFAKGETQRTFEFDVPAGVYVVRMVSAEGVGVVRVVIY